MTQPAKPQPAPTLLHPPEGIRSVNSAPRRRRYRAPSSHVSSALVVAACVAVHLLAATLIYRDVIHDLYALFDATPRLLVLERGLVRLTAIIIFLPPIVPTALLASVTLWLGKERADSDVAHWLALAAVPLAADGVLRAIGVVIAPAPSNMGELLDLPTRFSPGPRMVLDLLGAKPSPALAYWIVVCTVASAISAWCVARALSIAELQERDLSGRLRSRDPSAMDAMRAGTVIAGVWLALAFAGQVALPWVTQLILQTLG